MSKINDLNEITVLVKDSERRLKIEYPVYDEFSMKIDDPVVKKCIDDTLKEFKGEPESILVTVKLQVK